MLTIFAGLKIENQFYTGVYLNYSVIWAVKLYSHFSVYILWLYYLNEYFNINRWAPFTSNVSASQYRFVLFVGDSGCNNVITLCHKCCPVSLTCTEPGILLKPFWHSCIVADVTFSKTHLSIKIGLTAACASQNYYYFLSSPYFLHACHSSSDSIIRKTHRL